MGSILVIDDERSVLALLTLVLKSRQYDVVSADGGEAGKRALSDREYDMVLTDIRMDGCDGLEILRYAKEKWPAMPVVMMTGFATMESVKQAVALGAFDYIRKPLKVDDLLCVVDNAIQYGKAARTKSAGLRCADVSCYIPGVVAESDSMKQVCEMVKRVAPTMTTVLICGEPGVGKSLIAGAVRTMSRRSEKPFASIDCSVACRPGQSGTGELCSVIAGADSGTVLVERVESASPECQEILLNVLKNRALPARSEGLAARSVDVRVLATAETVISDLVAAGVFIEELYDRLRLIPIIVPPLRDRRNDILSIAQSILKQQAGSGSVALIAADVAEALTSYSWPGNTCELAAALKESLRQCTGGTITRDLLPETIAAAAAVRSAVVTKADDGRYKLLKRFLQTGGKSSSQSQG